MIESIIVELFLIEKNNPCEKESGWSQQIYVLPTTFLAEVYTHIPKYQTFFDICPGTLGYRVSNDDDDVTTTTTTVRYFLILPTPRGMQTQGLKVPSYAIGPGCYSITSDYYLK